MHCPQPFGQAEPVFARQVKIKDEKVSNASVGVIFQILGARQGQDLMTLLLQHAGGDRAQGTVVFYQNDVQAGTHSSKPISDSVGA